MSISVTDRRTTWFTRLLDHASPLPPSASSRFNNNASLQPPSSSSSSSSYLPTGSSSTFSLPSSIASSFSLALPRYLGRIETLCERFDIPYDQSSAVIVGCVALAYFGCYLSYRERKASEGKFTTAAELTGAVDSFGGKGTRNSTTFETDTKPHGPGRKDSTAAKADGESRKKGNGSRMSISTANKTVVDMTGGMKNIVIVGASSAGTSLAQSLSKSLPSTSTTRTHRIILLDSSPYAFWPVASLRAAVVPGWETKVSFPITTEAVFGRSGQGATGGEGERERHVFVRARVVELLTDGVRLESGSEFEGAGVIPFDILVLATGASQPFPMRPDLDGSSSDDTPPRHPSIQALEEGFRKMQAEIERSSRVLICGGGATGIELAGEILDRYPSKHVTLIHRNDTLLDSRFYAKLAKTLESKLKAKGAELILGDEHVQDQGWVAGWQEGMTTVKTKKGKSIEADYIFLAAGNKPNTSIVREADPKALEAKSGLINVNKFLQVESAFFQGDGRVFAVGDCANSEGWRSILAVDSDTAAASANILNVIKNSPASSLKPRVAGPRALVVPLGSKDGAGFAQIPLLGDSLLPGMATPMIKGKTLFVERFTGRYIK